ncbi:hypothetical protein ACHHYP_05954 [Achlya hypogyna]|uniref:Uncharacterized protein n=1 Tax=Achlya hypogyna TaxID=1202772 RepID=A0A1V9YW95_ACHHY|nr:hypothetical protein ACHHYP_05954 [Achlya hypogyna]
MAISRKKDTTSDITSLPSIDVMDLPPLDVLEDLFDTSDNSSDDDMDLVASDWELCLDVLSCDTDTTWLSALDFAIVV